MGMYTEFIFQGQTKDNIPDEIMPFLEYFFGYKPMDDLQALEKPSHAFFSCPRWYCVGRMGSHYFLPFSATHMQDGYYGQKHLFLRCDFKNYDNEIDLFIDWIKPYVQEFWGWHWHEDSESPTIFKYNKMPGEDK